LQRNAAEKNGLQAVLCTKRVTASWVIVIFGDDILTEGLNFKALTGATSRKRVWAVTIWITRILATASPKMTMSQHPLH
jgi:hypothetical protein